MSIMNFADAGFLFQSNLGAERLCKNGSSEGSGRKPRHMCHARQLLMTVYPSCEVD